MVYHVVLLGDSIFDNAKYVPGGQPVTAQLKKLLPRGSEVKLLAEDGASVTDGASIPVREQIKRIPSSSSHLVLSAGGNDALGESGRLDDPVGNVREALRILSTIRTGFQDSYHSIIELTQGSQKPLAICTIYEAIPGLTKEEQVALSIFNDTIVREALSAGSKIIDLRAICTEADDFSKCSPIEPSVKGGQKIAAAIASWITAR